jgi:hypothetical protein
VLLAACSPSLEGTECATDDDCPKAGRPICRVGFCVADQNETADVPGGGGSDGESPPRDATESDTGITDAETLDARSSDARLADATVADAAPPDAAEADAAVTDAAEADSTVTEVGVADAARPDAALPDAARPDAALPDAGPVCVPAAEVCNGEDDDCDGRIDLAAGGGPVCACVPESFSPCWEGPEVARGVGECRDGRFFCDAGGVPGTCDGAVLPADEACNGRDDDCNGSVDDVDDLGRPCVFGVGACARDGTLGCADGFPGAFCLPNPGPAPESGVEECNDIDDDCDGRVDEGIPVFNRWFDGDQDGYGDLLQGPTQGCALGAFQSLRPGDCADANPAINPGVLELCNGVDDDCDLTTDEQVLRTWRRDGDADGYGSLVDVRQACAAPPGYIERGGDCDDSTDLVSPEAPETCRAGDEDCDGQQNEAPAGQECAGPRQTGRCLVGRCIAECVNGAWDLNRVPDDGCERGCGAPVDGQVVSLVPLVRKPEATRIAADTDGQTWGAAWVDTNVGNSRVVTRLTRAGISRNFDFALVGRQYSRVEFERVPGAFVLIAGWLDPNGLGDATSGFDVFVLADGTDLPSIHALNTGAYNAFDAGVIFEPRGRTTRILIALDDAEVAIRDPRLNFEALTWNAANGVFGEFRSGVIETPLAERRVSTPPTVVAVQDNWLVFSRSTDQVGQSRAITADLVNGVDSIDGARAVLPESLVAFGSELAASVDDNERVIVAVGRADGLGFEAMRLDASGGRLQWIDTQSFIVDGDAFSGLTLSRSAGGFVLGYEGDDGGASRLRGAILSYDVITVVGGDLDLVAPAPSTVGGLHLTYGGGHLRASWWQRRAIPDEGFDIRAAILDCD